jgi:hypothetical protein
MDYMCDASVKARIDKAIKGQVEQHKLLPNLYGYTFLEEIPGNFGSWARKSEELPFFVQKYAAGLREKYGKELVWDYDLRKFIMQEYWVPAIKAIHAQIKASDGEGRPIFFWHKANTATNFPDGKPMFPYDDSQIIDGTSCDGYAAYYADTQRWFSEYLGNATRRSWPFIQQLSHPDGMRSVSFSHAAETVQAPVPGNLGYFFFGGHSPNKEDLFSREVQGKAGLPFRHVLPFQHPSKGNVVKFIQKTTDICSGLQPKYYEEQSEPVNFLDPAGYYMPVQPGETINYSFWLETGDIQGKEGFAMLVVPFDKQRTRKENNTVFIEKPGKAREGHVVSGSFKVDPGIHSIWIWIGLRYASGTACLDDFSLKNAEGKELIRNGGFEQFQTEPTVAVKGWDLSDYFALLPVQRNFCNQRGIGNEVVYRCFGFNVKLDAANEEDGHVLLTGTITNRKNPDYYLDGKLAEAQDIVTEAVVSPGATASPVLAVKQHLAAGESTVAKWRITAAKGGDYTARVIVTSKNRECPTATGYAEITIK